MEINHSFCIQSTEQVQGEEEKKKKSQVMPMMGIVKKKKKQKKPKTFGVIWLQEQRPEWHYQNTVHCPFVLSLSF